MSAGLENVRTLPELREWLKLRMRWLRDWHMAPKNPKPIPPPFQNSILSLYGESGYPPPSDPTKLLEWANLWIEKFSINTIHQTHDWLETHEVFGTPDWHWRDDPRILIEALEHLSALLNFVGVRASERSTPAGQAEGEPSEETGSDPGKIEAGEINWDLVAKVLQQPKSDRVEAEQAEGIDEQTRLQAIAELTPAVRKAYLAYNAACLKAQKKPDEFQDWESYKLLKEEGIPEDRQGELVDYRLPAKDTWLRYLGKARQALNEQKYTRRRGRPLGKSIVRADQIEQPENDD